MRYRLIKPDWGKASSESFKKEIPGPNTIEGDDFEAEFLAEKNKDGYGIYYFPNYNSKPKKGWLAGSDVDVFEWVFVDMDLKDKVYSSREEFIEKLLAFENIPNKIISSGNGIHAYWKIADLDREKYLILQKKLISHFKTDKSIWTVMQLMRVAGTFNTKDPNNYKLVEKDDLREEPYMFSQLSESLPDLNKEDENKIVGHVAMLDGVDISPEIEDLDLNSMPEKFHVLLNKSRKVQELFMNEEPGQRSERDFKLARILFNEDFSKPEAISVVANSPKALSKGRDRLKYAFHTVDKIYQSSTFTVQSVADKIKDNKSEVRRGRIVRGPEYFDCTSKGWKTQQCLGIVGGSGSGKSTVTLDIFKQIIENNANSDDIFIYFNLEMPDWEVIEKWRALTKNDNRLSERLYVVSNEDDEGNQRSINAQKIYWYCKDIQKSTGKKIAAIAIDHIGVINPTIDIRKKPDFGLVGEMEGAFNDYRNVSMRKMPQVLKDLAKMLDCFLIIQSQTTKAKGLDGDTPLGIDAAYGASQFEHYMDYVMTIWQPLRRVHDKTDLRVLGWQYCKIRHKTKTDRLDVYSPQMLAVDLNSGELNYLNQEELQEFSALNREATVLRKRTEKKDTIEYGSGVNLKRLRALS